LQAVFEECSMSIWGKIIGATAGLAFAGPIGAVVGGVAGHFTLDRLFEELEGPPDPDSPAAQLTFTMAVIALGAKMAKADGDITGDEIRAFKRLFRVPPGEEARLEQVFNLARQSVAGYEFYADQIGRLFRSRPAVLEDVLDSLFTIAMADSVLKPEEEAFLAEVARRFGLTEEYFQRVRAAHLGIDLACPYLMLGVDHDVSDSDLKSAYRKLVKEHHPDSLIARGVPEDVIQMATAKMARINAAYARILQDRAKAA
jgi:DnaJ like chaperone protein